MTTERTPENQTMTIERLNHLLNTDLYSPIVSLQIARLVLAIEAILSLASPDASQALEDYCDERRARDFFSQNQA